MCLIKTLERIQYLDYLIRKRCTGTAKELAQQIGVSQRTIFNYLSDFRSMGAPVSWSPSENSYIYHKSVQFMVGFRSDYPPEQDRKNPMILVKREILAGR